MFINVLIHKCICRRNRYVGSPLMNLRDSKLYKKMSYMITVKDSGFLPLSIHKRQKNVVYNTSRELFMTELIKFNLYYN